MRLIGGFDADVADWAGRQLGVKFVQPLAAFGIADSQNVARGAAVFNDYYRGGNIEWTHFGPGTLTRSLLRGLAHYCFVECGVSRVTCKTARKNVRVRRLLPKAGFEYETTQKRYYGPTKDDDALVFVLFRDKAQRWLEAGPHAGTAVPQSH